MTEKELTEECKLGNKDACRTLYETYSQTLMGIALRYTGGEDTARDVLHDSFIKIFIAIGRFRYMGDGSLRAWMSRIVANTALTFLENARELQFDSHLLEAETEDTDLREEDYRSVSDGVLMDFVRELPPGCRTVLNMYMFEDMSHHEICRQLGISDVASRVRLTRAKSLLAKKLNAYVEKQRI